MILRMFKKTCFDKILRISLKKQQTAIEWVYQVFVAYELLKESFKNSLWAANFANTPKLTIRIVCSGMTAWNIEQSIHDKAAKKNVNAWNFWRLKQSLKAITATEAKEATIPMITTFKKKFPGSCSEKILVPFQGS